MGIILICMPNSENASKLANMIRRRDLGRTEICALGNDVLHIAGEQDYGAVICTARMKDMSYKELLEYLPDNFEMLLMSADPEIGYGEPRVMKLSNPFKAMDLINTLDMMLTGLYSRIRKEKQKRKRSSSENRTIEDAKMLLMNRNSMTEPEAFRYIQKTAMDSGRTMVETAEMILMLNWDR